MLESTVLGRDESDERLVRGYLTALGAGRFLDALNAFSMDASFRDESGHERRGIREIAAAFARHERPLSVDIEELRHEGDVLSVQVRMRFPGNLTPRIYRSVFRIRRNRIDSLETDLLPASRPKKGRLVRPA